MTFIGYKQTKGHSNNIKKAMKGIKHSDRRKLNISEAMHNRSLKDKIKWKMNIGKAHKGKKLSEKIKRKIRQYWLNMTKEERTKRSENWIKAGQKAAQNINSSSIEKNICRILDSLNIKYETQYRIGKWFVDIYISDRKIIIECNGDYWHNYEIFPEKKIRDDKLQEFCDENGYKLIWLWENDINNNSMEALKKGFEIVKENRIMV